MANTTGKKFGGRKAGVPNKVTTDLRSWITSFLNEKKQDLENDWEKLNPTQKFALFEKLLRYSIPSLQQTEKGNEMDNLTDEQLDYLLKELRNAQRTKD